MKKVLIVGKRGFIGNNLAKYLKRFYNLKHISFKDLEKIKSQLNNLIFAFNVCRYVKSNAIVIAGNGSTIGIGSGQPSRLDSCQIAINKMKKFRTKTKEIKETW